MTMMDTSRNTPPKLTQSDASFPGHESEASDAEKYVVARRIPAQSRIRDSVSLGHTETSAMTVQ